MNSYLIEDEIGSGSYATVFKVISKIDNLTYAAKYNDVRDVESEVKVYKFLNTLKNPSFPIYYEHFNKCIITEYINGCNLRDYLKINQIDDKFRYSFTNWILRTVKLLHFHSLIHRDIKLENIMVTKTRFVLIDFGHSCFMNDDEAFYYFGTPLYECKELINSDYLLDKNLLYSIDFYASFVSIYYVFEGKFPFNAKNRDSLKVKILNNNVRKSHSKNKEIQEILNKGIKDGYRNNTFIDETIKTISNLYKNGL